MFFICFRAFSGLVQGFVQLLMSFLVLELSPASSNFAIACVSFCILDLFLWFLIIFMHCICISCISFILSFSCISWVFSYALCELVHMLVILWLCVGYAHDDIVIWYFSKSLVEPALGTWNAYQPWVSAWLWIAFAWMLALCLDFDWNSCSLQLGLWSRYHCKCLAHDASKGEHGLFVPQRHFMWLVLSCIKKNWMNFDENAFIKSFVLNAYIFCCLVVTWYLPKEVGTWFPQALTWLRCLYGCLQWSLVENVSSLYELSWPSFFFLQE